MNKITIIKTTLLSLMTFALLAVATGSAQAAQIDYNNPNNQPIQTPAFNTYTNVPNGVGNEADFVKLRKSTGDPTVLATVTPYTDPLSATCTVGEKFDISTYVHNGANSEFNNNGSGSSVAHQTRVALTAPLGVKSQKFTFQSTISAQNATSVTDTGVLNCGNSVMLKLVPQSVKTYSRPTSWNSASDSAVNGSLLIGSRAAGSGDQWGCWEDRIMVVYVVEVVEAPKPTPVYTCDAITVEKIGERKYRFGVKYTALNGAVLKNVKYNFGDDKSQTVAINPFTSEHEYTTAGEFKTTTDLTFTVNSEEKTVTDAKCAVSIKTSVTPPVTPPVIPPVTTIPSTGLEGMIAGLFGTSATAYAIYAWIASRRSLKNIV